MDPGDARARLRELMWSVARMAGPVPPMSELVARLDAWLSRHRPAYHARLLPGLTDEEWVGFESRIGLKLPDAFRVFYQWRNGQPNDYFKSFRGNRTWTPTVDIIDTKELLDSMIGSDFEPGWWEQSWVPFLHNGAGSHLCVDVAGANGGTPGQLVEFWNRDRDRPVAAPSLEHWLHQFVRSLERDR